MIKNIQKTCSIQWCYCKYMQQYKLGTITALITYARKYSWYWETEKKPQKALFYKNQQHVVLIKLD